MSETQTDHFEDITTMQDMQRAREAAARRMDITPASNSTPAEAPNATPDTRGGLKRTTGIVTAAGVGIALGATGALVVENALNHSEPTQEDLQTHALSSTIITPSFESGDLISSAEEGVAFLTENATTYNSATGEHETFISIPYERIVTESQEAQEEYTRISGAPVQKGAQFKLYLLEKEDGSYDIEINPETNNER